jgi:hypothetical protein
MCHNFGLVIGCSKSAPQIAPVARENQVRIREIPRRVIVVVFLTTVKQG